MFPTDVVEHGPAAGRQSEGRRISTTQTISRSSALSANDLALMTRQFATLLVAGLPLVEALGVLVDQAEKKPVKSLFADVREQIRGRKIARDVEKNCMEQIFRPSMCTWFAPVKRSRSVGSNPVPAGGIS